MSDLVIDLDPRKQARHLYWSGWRVARIAEALNEKPATVHSWKKRDKWSETSPVDRVEMTLEMRIIEIAMKDKMEPIDYKTIDVLSRQMERMSRVKKHDKTGKEVDLNPNVSARHTGPRKKPAKNEISEAQEALLLEAFQDSLFSYQKTWYNARLHRIREILKSRQIGATWYFAREAFCDAMVTGKNKIFLSASKAQAHVFKLYMQQFARDVADVELTGEQIVLENNATLYFLGTNSKTAQSYHGDIYMDEFFWINRFKEFQKVASGMASQRHWKQTYISTPSTVTHEAHDFWTGESFNKGRPKDQQLEIDTSHFALKNGVLCPDKKWRQIVTIEDALAGGCNLFDIEALKFEYGPEDFANLFQCKFIDDDKSVFPLAQLQAGAVDSWVDWANDFKPLAPRPFANGEVWLGYDPALSGDSAALVVLAPPARPGGKFRILERHQFQGMDFAAQASAIEKATKRYNVTYIGIDKTGIGAGVHQLVMQFFPRVVGFNYNPELKFAMVMKATDVFKNGRLEYDAGWNDIPASFMSIKKTLTPSGTQITYKAGRSKATSHADIAWATMHALMNEPLEIDSGNNQNILEIHG